MTVGEDGEILSIESRLGVERGNEKVPLKLGKRPKSLSGGGTPPMTSEYLSLLNILRPR